MNDQNDLRDDVDPKLQQLYRQLPKEQPSAELDKKILAAAKIAKPLHIQKKTHHWQAPFALAASVVLVSSVVLYLHEENPAAFDVKTESPAQVPATNGSRSEPAPSEMAKPAMDGATTTNNLANTKVLANNADQKTAPNKAKDIPIIQPEKAQATTANALDDHRLTAQAEKKAEMTHRADQVAAVNAANQTAKLMQANNIAKEQETQRARVENDQSLATSPAPAPIIAAPAQQMQPQPEVAERRSIQASRLQDSNRASQQYSAVGNMAEESTILEKSNIASAPRAAAPSPSMSSMSSLAGAALSMAKQGVKHDETTQADYAQNISAPVLSIEGIAIGMDREQLVAQGMTCYIDVCHLDLSQPKQETYWGIPAQNAHLTTFLSHKVVSKLVLKQKNAQINQVKTALSNIGIASEKSCTEEKEPLLIGRQLGENVFNLRSMGVGLSLTICQHTKSINKP